MEEHLLKVERFEELVESCRKQELQQQKEKEKNIRKQKNKKMFTDIFSIFIFTKRGN